MFAFLKRLAPSSLTVLLLITSAAPGTGQTSNVPPPAEPEVISVFPPGGMPGGKLEVEIRGKTLEGAYALWSEDGDFTAHVTKVEEIQPIKKEAAGGAEDAKDVPLQRAIALIEIPPNARIGGHRFRLVSPLGVSNSLTFQVVSTPVSADSSTAHNLPTQAQPVRLSAVINGQIDKAGDLNYYSFEARKGEHVKFEIDGSGDVVEVYGHDESWFDPDRIEKLSSEKNAPPGVYRFARHDKYLARVKGEPDSSYQLRMISMDGSASASGSTVPAVSADSQWRERTFTRRISPDRMQLLWSRTLAAPPLDLQGAGSDPAGAAVSNGSERATNNPVAEITEVEPNETTDQASEVSIPVILQGAIQRPGDVDNFKFKVKPGERLAFEIETPAVTSPYFNPLVRILDSRGQEVMTNVYKRIPVQSMEYWGTVEPKTIHTFREGGEYFCQVRDVTTQHGEPGFRYRILIRPQIPHVGEVQVAEVVQHAANDTDILADRVNLVPGYSKKLTVTTEREEEFSGEIAVTLDNLPSGVEVFPGTEAEGDQVAPHDEGLKQSFRPEIEQVVILLLAKEDAAVTPIPQTVQVSVRPIVPGRVSRWYKTGLSDNVVRAVTQGKIGSVLQVQNFPLMVVKPPAEVPALNRIADQSKPQVPGKQDGPR